MATKTRAMTFNRQEFLRHLFSPEVDFNATEAYRRAYPNCKTGHNRMANRLMSCDVIKKVIAKKQVEIAVRTGFTIEKAQRMYEEDRQFARKCNQAGAGVSATTGICRLYGMDKDAGGGEKTIIIISPKASKVIDSKEI